MHSRLYLTAFLCVALGCGSDSGPSSPTAKTYDVYTVGNTFSPSFLSIAVGDTVRFNFTPGADNMGHDVTFDATPAGHPASIPVQKTGTTPRAFNTRGSFHYNCFVHPGMQGDVVVQ